LLQEHEQQKNSEDITTSSGKENQNFGDIHSPLIRMISGFFEVIQDTGPETQMLQFC
jgi:hypothetical protein